MINSSFVRRPRIEDVEQIEQIAEGYGETNPLPSEFETAAVYENNVNKIIAFGCLRVIEILLYITGNNKEKVLAIKNLLMIAVSDAKKLKHENIYVFAEDEHFARILEKHFNFRRLNGIPMILNLEK